MSGIISLESLLRQNDIGEDVLTMLKSETFKITNTKQFANFFENRAEIASLFCKHASVKIDNPAVIANLKQCWREAEAAVERSLKRSSSGMPEEDIDDPLKEDDNKQLEVMYKNTYSFSIPPTWRAPNAILGRLHREFMQKSHVAFIIKKIASLELSEQVGQCRKKLKIGLAELNLPFNIEGENEITVHSCFGYLHELKIVLYTMSLAGAFKVTKGDGHVLFAPLEDLLAHLAAAEKFVITHANGRETFPDSDILKQLRKIDETIRTEWARRVRSEPSKSLGEHVQDLMGFSTSLWLQAPITTQVYHAPPRNQQPQPIGSPVKAVKAKGDSKGKDKMKGAGKAKGKEPRSDMPAGAMCKTTKYSSNGKTICKGYNDARGCQNPACAFVHCCDVLMSTNKACSGTTHNRASHSGPKIPL